MSCQRGRGSGRTCACSGGTVRSACNLLALVHVGCLFYQCAALAREVWDLPDFWKAAHAVGDLPRLPSDEHGPNSTSWRNSVGICATMKHENSTDLREWLTYHRWLGVEHVYLTENAERPTAALRRQVRDFELSGFVTYGSEERPRSQLKVYYDCAAAHAAAHNWLAFIDVDEFLLLQPPGAQKLPEFLDAYRHEAGLAVHWVIVGPSGRHTRPAGGGVLRHYTQCEGKGRHMVKTIANTFYLANIASHPHNFEFWDGKLPVDEARRLIMPRFKTVCLPMAAEREEGQPRCYNDAGSMVHPPSVAKAALFHFTTKSHQDFAAKLSRGSAMTHRGKNWRFFERVARDTKESGGLCGLPAAAADLCCPPEALTLGGKRGSGP